MEQKQRVYDFDENFEKKILYIFLSDSIFYLTNQKVLNPNYFNVVYLVNIAKAIQEHYSKFKRPPSEESLIVMLKEKFPDEKDTYEKYVYSIFNCDRKDLDFVASKALEWGKHQDIIIAMQECVEYVDKKDFGSFEKRMKETLYSNSAPLTLGHNFVEGFDERRISTGRIDLIPTQIRLLDQYLNGGLGRGELGVVIGPPGGGKTSSLVNFGKAALSLNKKVLYITLEMSEIAIAFKFEACTSGVPISSLHDPKFRQDINKMRDKFNSYGGSLHIKWFPMYLTSFNDVEVYLEFFRMNTGYYPDLVIVDYPDLIKLESTDVYSELGNLYGKLRSLGGLYNFALWCGSQTNRGGISKDVITQADIAESFKKCGPADIMLGISRADHERKLNIFRYFIAKNRWGVSDVSVAVESYLDKSLIIDANEEKLEILKAANKDS